MASTKEALLKELESLLLKQTVKTDLQKKELLERARLFMLDVGDLLNIVEESAHCYWWNALDGLILNAKYYKLSKKDVELFEKNPKAIEKLIVAILADFINHMAQERGGNRGELPSHITRRKK